MHLSQIPNSVTKLLEIGIRATIYCGSNVSIDSMADGTRMNQLTESFAALKKTVEKNEAQA